MQFAPPLFVVECACGAKARGERLSKHQIIPCTNCGRPLFVFPDVRSPFGGADGSSPPGVRRHAWRAGIRLWLAPAAAGLLALAVVAAVVFAILRGHRAADSGASPVRADDRAADRLAVRFDAVQAALAEGSYRTALRELDALAELRVRFPRQLEPDNASDLTRWRRQVALLADLLSESVNEIVQHSIGLPDREWDAIFRERYAGRSLLLDARVFRDAAGHYRIDYQLESAGAAGTWEFDRLQLFARIPLAQPQRLLFGFRLQSVRRTARDRWVVVPEPESGVLLTDAVMLAGLSLPTDPELLEVLKRQAGWGGSLD